MKLKLQKNGRTTDLELNWLTKQHGVEWANWRLLAKEWIASQVTNLSTKLSALHIFFDIYLVPKNHWANSISLFFEGNSLGEKISTEALKLTILESTNRSDNQYTTTLINYIVSFI